MKEGERFKIINNKFEYQVPVIEFIEPTYIDTVYGKNRYRVEFKSMFWLLRLLGLVRKVK